jgi:hypothetical protein
MEYHLTCECGERVPVAEGAAGTSVRCACGKNRLVPSLWELRGPAQEEAASPSLSPRATAPQVIMFVGLIALTVIVPLVGIVCGIIGLFRKTTRVATVVLIAIAVASAAVRMWLSAARFEGLMR